MEYKYCKNGNFEDYASGRVIYSDAGVPNFPVRLINEIFGHALEISGVKENLCVYDPCCGGGYSLTVLGFWHGDKIKKLCGSDIDSDMVQIARKNTSLLTKEGLMTRRQELEKLYALHSKPSHAEALESLERLSRKVKDAIELHIFEADCTKELALPAPDIIITDIPYGDLVSWEGGSTSPLEDMFTQLTAISYEKTVLAVSMDKKQKVVSAAWKRVRKQLIGKRKFEIYVRSGSIGEQ